MADNLEHFLYPCWNVISADSKTQNNASSVFTQRQVGLVFPPHWSSKCVLITVGKTMDIARRKLRGQLLKSCLDVREHPRLYINLIGWFSRARGLKKPLRQRGLTCVPWRKNDRLSGNTHHIGVWGKWKKKKVYKSMRYGTHLFLLTNLTGYCRSSKCFKLFLGRMSFISSAVVRPSRAKKYGMN